MTPLDPNARHDVWRLIRESDGAAVVLRFQAGISRHELKLMYPHHCAEPATKPRSSRATPSRADARLDDVERGT